MLHGPRHVDIDTWLNVSETTTHNTTCWTPGQGKHTGVSWSPLPRLVCCFSTLRLADSGYVFCVYGGYWENFTHFLLRSTEAFERISGFSSCKFLVSGSHVLGVWMLLVEFCLLDYGHYFYEHRVSGTLSVVCSWVAEWRSVLSRCLSCSALVSEMYAEWRSMLSRCLSCLALVSEMYAEWRSVLFRRFSCISSLLLALEI